MVKAISLRSNAHIYTLFASITSPNNNKNTEVFFDSLAHISKQLIRLMSNATPSIGLLLQAIFTKIWTIFPFWKPENFRTELYLPCLTSRRELLAIYSRSKLFRSSIQDAQILASIENELLHDRSLILSLLTSSSLSVSIAALQLIRVLAEFHEILLRFVSSSDVLSLLLTLLTTKKNEHIKLVAFGPIQKKVDEGIELRTQAWQTICDLMSTASFHQLVKDSEADAPMLTEISEVGQQRVDISMVIEAIRYGLQDEYDVRILVIDRLLLLIKWLPMQPSSIISLGAALVACQATITNSGASQMEDIRQEVEGIEHLNQIVARASGSLVTYVQQGTNFSLTEVETVLNSPTFIELERFAAISHSRKNLAKC
jgi:hypothetical protein